MTTDKNNSVIKINSDELVQHKNKFKSIAIYEDQQYNSSIVELTNETYKTQALTIQSEEVYKEGVLTNEIKIIPTLAVAVNGVKYSWIVKSVDGITDLLKTEADNFTKADGYLIIKNQWDINKFITIQAFAFTSTGIYIASSNNLIVYEKDVDLISALTVDLSNDNAVIPADMTNADDIKSLTRTQVRVYRGDADVSALSTYKWSASSGATFGEDDDKTAFGSITALEGNQATLTVEISVPKGTEEGNITLAKTMHITRGAALVYNIVPSAPTINISSMSAQTIQIYPYSLQQLTGNQVTSVDTLPLGHQLKWGYFDNENSTSSNLTDLYNSNGTLKELEYLPKREMSGIEIFWYDANNTLLDRERITFINDGLTAYLTNPTIGFNAGADGKVIGASKTSEIKVRQGLTDITDKISSVTKPSALPEGMTIDINDNEITIKVVESTLNSGVASTSGQLEFIVKLNELGLEIPLTLGWIKLVDGDSNIGTEYYQATSTNNPPDRYSNGNTIDSKWRTTIAAAGQNITTPYLWNFERIIYTSGKTPIDTEVSLLSASPRGIAQIIEYYTKNITGIIPTPGATTDDTTHNTAPNVDTNTWKTTRPSLKQGDYLYNFEVVQYSTVDAEGKNLYSWTEPVQIAYLGKDGKAIGAVTEYYARSKTETQKPTTSEVKDDNGIVLSEAWSTTFTAPNKDLPYLWNYEVSKYNDTDNTQAAATDPVIIAYYTENGRSIKSIQNYYLINTGTKPTSRPAATAANEGNDANVWYKTAPKTTETNRFLWNSEIITYLESDGITETSSAPTEPACIGTHGAPGEDGSNIEYVYYRSKTEKSSLIAPTESDIQSQPNSVDDTMGNKWYPSPLGITSVWKYEYVSIRTKPAGTNTNWTSFSTPVIWSKWGEKGQDGDGVEYKYYLSNSETPPTYNSSDEWTDEPSGVSFSKRYEYVVQIKTTTINDITTSTPSTPSLWAKWSEDGKESDGIKYKYCLINSATKPVYPAPANADYTWTDEPTGVSESNQYEYVVSIITSPIVTVAKKIDTELREYNEETWKGYGATGHEENWTIRGTGPFDNSHIHLQDYAYVEGIIAGSSPVQPVKLYGRVIGLTQSSTSGGNVRMRSEFLMIGDQITSDVVLWAKWGNDGRGIIEVVEWYQATSFDKEDDNNKLNDDNWENNISDTTFGEKDKYLWNYEVIKYSSAPLEESTDPAVIATYSKDGNNGRGIQSIENYYQLRSDENLPAITPSDIISSPPTEGSPSVNTWYNAPVQTTAINKYLWNCEKITYDDGSDPTFTTPARIGTHGEKGNDGSGIAIFRSTYQSVTTTQLNNWSQAASDTWVMYQTPVDNQGNVLKVGDPFYAQVHCISDNKDYAILLHVRTAYSAGEKSIATKNAQGYFQIGDTGPQGAGILTEIEVYQLSEEIIPPSIEATEENINSWIEKNNLGIFPNDGRDYLWRCLKQTWNNGNTTFTTPILLSDYEMGTLFAQIEGLTIAEWCERYDRTLINGSTIATGTITAKQINTEGLSAEYIQSNNYTSGEETEGLSFTPVDGGYAVAWDQVSSITDVIIPSTYMGSPVVEIQAGAFNNSPIETLVIPSTIKKLNQNSLQGLSSLKVLYLPYLGASIDEPKNLTFLTQGMLTNLNKIVILRGAEIEDYAFYQRASLTEIVLPSTLKIINTSGVFTGCTNLKTLKFMGTEDQWNSIQGIDSLIFDTDVEIIKNHIEKVPYIKALRGFKISSLDSEPMINSLGFQVTQEGDIAANSGKIAGWDISKDSISKDNVGLTCGSTKIPSIANPGSDSNLRFFAGNNELIESVTVYIAGGEVIVDDNGYHTEFSATITIPDLYTVSMATIVSNNILYGGTVLYISWKTPLVNNELKTIRIEGSAPSDCAIAFGDITVEYVYTSSMYPNKVMILEDGSLHASAAKISGTIDASEGNIGNLKVLNGGLTYENDYSLNRTGLTLNNINSSIKVGTLSIYRDNVGNAYLKTTGTLKIIGENNASISLSMGGAEDVIDLQFALYAKNMGNNQHIIQIRELNNQAVFYDVEFNINYDTIINGELKSGDVLHFEIAEGEYVSNTQTLTIYASSDMMDQLYFNNKRGFFVYLNSSYDHFSDGNSPVLNDTSEYFAEETQSRAQQLIKIHGDLDVSGNITHGSDRNLKNTIFDISNSYDKMFDNLRPVTYRYNENPNKIHTGFIAQEVEGAMASADLVQDDFAGLIKPSMVGNNEFYKLDYTEFIALCVDQIQKLKKRVEELEQRLL